MESVVDDTKQSELAAVHRSGTQQGIRVEVNGTHSPPSSNLSSDSSTSVSSSLSQTVPVVNEYELRKSQLVVQFMQCGLSSKLPTIREEIPDYVEPKPFSLDPFPNPSVSIRQFQLPNPVEDATKDSKLNIKQEVAAQEQTVPRSRTPVRNAKPKCLNALRKAIKSNSKVPEITISYKVPKNYCRPPHPYDVGKVCIANICSDCHKYTVTELPRPPNTSPSQEALWARFRCGRCEKVFDLGITLYDPRGVPGVTLYEGEDRFRPPVPPQGRYPCPRCLKSNESGFVGMTLYLREVGRVVCKGECDVERLCALPEGNEARRRFGRKVMGTVLESARNWERILQVPKGEEERRILGRRIMGTVLGRE